MIDSEELIQAGAGLHDRFGTEAASRFGADLPDRLRVLTSQWGIEVGPLVDSGASAVVLGALLATGEPAVVKVSPDAEALARQVWMLEHLAPTGRVPAVYDAAVGAVLMERVLPGEEAGTDGRVPPSEEEWADLLRDLHSTAPAPVVDRLDDRCADMFERIGARQAVEGVRAQVPDATWERAIEVCRRLLEGGGDQAAIHGDLHLGNALTSDQHGLVAVDPKLCVGDRCFDMVDFVAVAGDTEQMAARARRLAGLTGVDPDRLLAWSAVNAVVTAISRITWFGSDQRSQELLAFSGRYLR
ncbi:aminoglycoside phosphotransferase family protein [Ruania zhangjianzhongii]|uniref:aminoglycoside phosphotransferase family protein n=1 Tax=Ruania zhangjianzhongii TaxID=2603206 RepID=UPI0011C979F8|nr:aminoglycoside phosphotransferase family protein [Ruania zhangjianzhongii]